jgi:hypothetical protein
MMRPTKNGKSMMPQNAEGFVQLLVLDPRCVGWAALLADAEPGMAVLVLDPGRDGLTQIAEVADEIGPLSAIHIAGQEISGQLQLGCAVLDAACLRDRQQELTRLGHSIAAGGALLLGGQAVGAGTAGARFLAELSHALARDVGISGSHAALSKPASISSQVTAAPYQAEARQRIPAL